MKDPEAGEEAHGQNTNVISYSFNVRNMCTIPVVTILNKSLKSENYVCAFQTVS